MTDTTSTRFVKVFTQNLQLGMYVVELDRPWMDTPFLVQGFVIRTPEEIETLRKLCSFVYVDNGRSVRFSRTPLSSTRGRKPLLGGNRANRQTSRPGKPYQDTASLAQELDTANNIYQDYEQTVARLYGEVRTSQKLDLEQVNGAITAIVDSVVRNPDACMLLAKLRRKGDYIYNHAIGSSIWAAALGRQLGLPKSTLASLATGALLSDVGKVNLSDRILNKPGELDSDELALVRSHVDQGIALVKRTPGVDVIARQMVLTHHERHNGKGYPRGLRGAEIPVYGRIAAIVDTYDALINDKPYRPAMPPNEAIKVLYHARDTDFQAELVEEFIQAVGVYPSGSLVELSNGVVGVVVTEHRRRRLRPKLLLLLDGDKNPLPESTYLDLYQVTHDATGNPLDIRRTVMPDEYGIDPDDIFI